MIMLTGFFLVDRFWRSVESETQEVYWAAGREIYTYCFIQHYYHIIAWLVCWLRATLAWRGRNDAPLIFTTLVITELVDRDGAVWLGLAAL